MTRNDTQTIKRDGVIRWTSDVIRPWEPTTHQTTV